MTFLSFSFILLFALLALLYFVLPKKCQWILLLIFSYAFYFFASEKLPVYMLITTAVTYFAAIGIQRIKDKTDNRIKSTEDITKEEKKALRSAGDKKRKTVLIIAVCINIGILSVFKYTDFVFSNISSILISFGVPVNHAGFNLLLPLGISFYTFQSTGYIIDVYRKQVTAEKNFFKAALFVSYFPQIIEGPIGRFNALAPQLFAEHKFSFDRTKKAVFLIVWGFFKKLVIADNLAPMVNEISENYSAYSGITIFLGMLFYGIQLYTDFSGYMDIAMGFSNILGIELAPNFKRPYFSQNLAEFWRRWHISLCSWFRDYLFYPMFMSKRSMNIAKKLRAKGYKTAAKNVPTFIAMAIVWFLTGLWHGACWTEIVWGFSNGLIMIFSQQFKDTYETINNKLRIKTDSSLWKVFRIIRTYLLVTLLNFICEFNTLSDSVKSFSLMITAPLPQSLSLSEFLPKIIETGIFGIAATLAACVVLFLHSLYEERNGSIIEALFKKNWLVQFIVFCLFFFYIVLFGANTNNLTAGFMYAQF